MTSNKKPLIIAFVCSFVIFGAILSGVFLLLRSPGLDIAPLDVTGTETGEQRGTAAPAAESVTRPVDESRITEKQTLTVRVREESSGNPVRNSRIVVSRALDGERGGGPVVFSTDPRSANADGVFRPALLPGAYFVQAQAQGYQSKSATVTLLAGEDSEVEFLLSRGLSISGVVVDIGQRPIGGAIVRAYKEIGKPEDDLIQQMIELIDIKERTREIPAETVTLSDGTYQLDGLESVYYTVNVVAEQYAPKNRANVLPTASNIDFRLDPGSIFLGMVVDPGGNGVAGATIDVYPEVDSQDIIKVVQAKSRPALVNVATDSRGNFEILSLGDGQYNLVINASNFQPKYSMGEQIRSGDRNEFRTYTLSPGLTIAGEVVDTEGRPVAGANVRPIRMSNRDRSQTVRIDFDDGSITTDANGYFAFNNLVEAKYNLLVWHNDYSSKQVRDVAVGSTALSVILSGGGAISGRVVQDGSGQPISGAAVVVTDLMDIKKEGITDASGNYYVGGLNSKRGKRFVSVQAPGFARVSNESIEVEEGAETQNVDFFLQPTAGVVGRVVKSNGESIGSARVTAKRPAKSGYPVPVGSAVTDVDGTFSIQLEGGAETTLTVMSSSFLEFTGAPFEVQPGATYQSEDLVLRLGAMVEGVVVDPSGNGVEGAVVAPREEGEPEFSLTKTAKTDRRGRFALKGMNPGVVALQAKSSHHVEAVLENVEIREGEITPVTLRLQRGQRLAGRVSDDAGSPVSSALVVAREFVTSMKEHRQQTDAEGRFAFENLLSEDTVEISVSHKDYSPYNNQRVPISGEVLEIELEPLGSLAGVVVDVDGTPLGTFSVQPHQVGEAGPNRVRLSSQTFSTDDGRFTFPGVPGGLYEVAVSAEGFSSVSLREVSVTNGELTDLGRIALQDGGIVDGVVVDGATGQPVSGARVRVTNGPSAFLQRGGAQSKLITDSLGAFTFRGLKDSDNITLRVEHDDYMTQDVNRISTADATTSRGLEIVLGVGAEISGVVVDSAGTPKRAHQVFLSAQGGLRGRSGANKTGRTDRSGRFTFASIQPGTYRVTAKALRAGASLNTAEVEVGGGEAVEVNLQVD